jgi:hypothetical protein
MLVVLGILVLAITKLDLPGWILPLGLIVAGIAYAAVRAMLLRRTVKSTAKRVDPLKAGISAGMRDIDTGVARAQAGAETLNKEIEELRVSVAELRVIGKYAQVAFAEISGPLGWLAGIRALIKFRGR